VKRVQACPCQILVQILLARQQQQQILYRERKDKAVKRSTPDTIFKPLLPFAFFYKAFEGQQGTMGLRDSRYSNTWLMDYLFQLTVLQCVELHTTLKVFQELI